MYHPRFQSGSQRANRNRTPTHIRWSEHLYSAIQLVLVLANRLLVDLNLPLQIHYFHLQRSHMTITMGTRNGDQVILRQYHPLGGGGTKQQD